VHAINANPKQILEKLHAISPRAQKYSFSGEIACNILQESYGTSAKRN